MDCNLEICLFAAIGHSLDLPFSYRIGGYGKIEALRTAMFRLFQALNHLFLGKSKLLCWNPMIPCVWYARLVDIVFPPCFRFSLHNIEHDAASFFFYWKVFRKLFFGKPQRLLPAGFPKQSSQKRNKKHRRCGFMPDFDLTAQGFRLSPLFHKPTKNRIK